MGSPFLTTFYDLPARTRNPEPVRENTRAGVRGAWPRFSRAAARAAPPKPHPHAPKRHSARVHAAPRMPGARRLYLLTHGILPYEIRMCGVGPEGSPLRPIKGHQRQSVQVLSDEGSPLRSEGPHQLPCSMLCSYVILEALACTCFHMLVLQSSHQRRGEHLHARAFVDCSPPVGSWPSSHQRRGEHLHAGRPSPPPVGSWLS